MNANTRIKLFRTAQYAPSGFSYFANPHSRRRRERFEVLQSGVGGTAFHIAQSRIYKIDMKSNGEICNCMFRCRCVHYIICCRFMLYLKQGILAYGKNIKKIGTADIRAETYKSAPELHAF